MALDLDIELCIDNGTALPAPVNDELPALVGPETEGDSLFGQDIPAEGEESEVEDPPCPLAKEDERRPWKMSKAEEAMTEQHMLTHKPFNPRCPNCVKGKSRNAKSHKNAFQR